VEDYQSKDNVVRASSILTSDKWTEIFPNALSLYTYDNFLQAMAKFPKFCDEAKDATDEDSLVNACKVELATLLAHMKYSSENLTKVEDDCATTGGWACKYNRYSPIYSPDANQQYYGRGPLMMKYSNLYGALSSIAWDGALNDKEVLLQNPD